MKLPPLDGRGFLPDGCYITKKEEIKQKFAFNDHRRSMWTKFITFLDFIYSPAQASKYIGISKATPLFISGSYLSNKSYPRDIDCVFLLHNLSHAERWFWSARQRHYNQEMKTRFNVDFNLSFTDGNDLLKFFSYIGPKEAEVRNLDPSDLRGVIRLDHE